jgi:hypothetical protein
MEKNNDKYTQTPDPNITNEPTIPNYNNIVNPSNINTSRRITNTQQRIYLKNRRYNGIIRTYT